MREVERFTTGDYGLDLLQVDAVTGYGLDGDLFLAHIGIPPLFYDHVGKTGEVTELFAQQDRIQRR